MTNRLALHIARVRRKAVWGSHGTRRKAVWGWRGSAGVAVLLGVMAALVISGCSQAREGQAASYLQITELTGSNACSGASGAGSGTVMESDVQCGTTTPPVFTISDLGQASLQLQLKDPGGESSPNTPSPVNAITLTQYHVDYTRTDGHNVQGIDIPYSFDGALTSTISNTGTVSFTLVRLQAKEEAPLQAIITNNIPLTVIATVTFYGHDQTGRSVSVSGSIQITFANFSS